MSHVMVSKEELERLEKAAVAVADVVKPSLETSAHHRPEKRDNELMREKLGEETPKTADDSDSSSSSDDEEEESATSAVADLPCRRKREAAAFMRRLVADPSVRLKRGQIWLDGRLLGKAQTVLQHFFGQERLGARDVKRVGRFLSAGRRRRLTDGRASIDQSAPADSRRRSHNDSSLSSKQRKTTYNGDLLNGWSQLGLGPTLSVSKKPKGARRPTGSRRDSKT